VTAWLARTGMPRGTVVTFSQMWALVQPWYRGRLSRDWRGRTVDEAERILAEVGMTDDFWRLR
jgi:hypothetical protein